MANTQPKRALVKICGFVDLADAKAALDLDVDAIGLNFWPKSKRFVNTSVAEAISTAARHRALRVGVFVNAQPDEILATARLIDLDLIQLHGDEEPALGKAIRAAGLRVIRAIRVGEDCDIDVELTRWNPSCADEILFDSATIGFGGSGIVFDWKQCQKADPWQRRRWVAGGLSAENVQAALAETNAEGCDVAGGVEASVEGAAAGATSQPRKDPIKMANFVAAARGTALGRGPNAKG